MQWRQAAGASLARAGLARLQDPGYTFEASSSSPTAIANHSARATVFKVRRTATLSISQLYFASMLLSFSRLPLTTAARRLRCRGCAGYLLLSNQLLHRYTNARQKGSVNKL